MTESWRQGRVGHLDGLRRWWLAQPSSTAASDYNRFARDHNARASGKDPKLVTASVAVEGLGLSWTEALVLLREEATIAELHRARAEQHVDNPEELDLVGTTEIAHLFGDLTRRAVGEVIRRSDFPTVVATVGGSRGWLRADVVAYRDGDPVPVRMPGSEQHRILDSTQMARHLGLALKSFRMARVRGSRSVRPEDGKLGRKPYWLAP